MNTQANIQYAEKRVAHANRLNAERTKYHSPSIEEIAARAHARTNPAIRTNKQVAVWEPVDYLYAVQGFLLVAAVLWYLLSR